jgi:hypothetical protein
MATQGTESGAAGNGLIARLADPVLAYADRLATVQGERQSDLVRHAATLLDRFTSGLQRAGLPGPAVPPLRAALALILDQKARANRAIDVGKWGEDSRRLLFDGREVSSGDLAEYQHRAEGHPDHREAAAFVGQCLSRLDMKRREFDTSPAATGWGGILAVLALAFVLVVVGWAAWVEWRFHRDLASAFSARALDLGLDRDGPFPDLATRLDGLASEARNATESRLKAPVNLFAGLMGYDAADMADANYQTALQRHLPRVMAHQAREQVDRGFQARLSGVARFGRQAIQPCGKIGKGAVAV